MINSVKRACSTLIATLLLAFVALPVHASLPTSQPPAESGGAGVGFFVRALIPENQVDTRLSYFDLRMQPGQRQTLQVEVVNESDEPLVIDVSAISASTGRNAVIDYKTPDVRDETLRYPFSQLAEVETPTVEVAPFGTALVSLRLEMPAEEYDGVVLGGILMTKRNPTATETTSAQAAQPGASIQNVYSYVIGVTLRETDVEVAPDFELLSVQYESVNYRPALVHYLRNFEAAIVKNMNMVVDIVRESDGATVAHIERDDVDMAPNSVLALAITPDIELTSGEYTSTITLSLGEESWQLRRTFIVGQEDIDEVEDTIITERGGLPAWAIILIVLAALLLIALLLIIFLLAKRRKEEDDLEE